MAVTKVRTKWSSGNLLFTKTDGTVIMTVDGTNRDINIPTGATLTVVDGIAGVVSYAIAGEMAAAGTGAANDAGVLAKASRGDHVHALGAHDHSGATVGGNLAAVIIASITLTGDIDMQTSGTGTYDLILKDAVADALSIKRAGTDVIVFDTATPRVTITPVTTITGVLTASAGISVTTGGVTVVAGGVTVTGNSTITGDLAVTGALTFGGNWTVGATLTVDELILDTDGVAPAATNCYAVRDNGGDLTVNAITGKQFIVAINNTDEYTLSATILDMLDNALDNCGYLILNAATAPAGTEVYAVNDNTGDLTLNALNGKMVHLAINGTDEYDFSAAALALATNNLTLSTGYIQFSGAGYVDLGATGYLLAGTAGDATGKIRLANNTWISAENNAGNGNVNLISVNASDLVAFGVNLAAYTAGGLITAAAGVAISNGQTLKFLGDNGIVDSAGNEILNVVAAVNATNNIQFTNAANGSPPLIESIGSADANIDIQMKLKGTGSLDATHGTAPTAANPTYTIDGDTDTGLFGGTNIYAVATNGVERVKIDALGNLLFNAGTASAAGAGTIVIKNAAVIPNSQPADEIQLYAQDVAASSELKVMDEASNVTVLSPHAFELFTSPDPMAWCYHSENIKTGKVINVDMFTAIREVERLGGKKLIYTSNR